MQITLNKIPFEVKPVDGGLRAALMADPVVARGVVRPVWAWDKDAGKGRHLAPVAANQALPLPTGILVHVQKHGPNGSGFIKAEGPTAKMAERFLAAVGAKDFGQVIQALARVTGVPVKKVPLDQFAPLNTQQSYAILMATELQVLEGSPRPVFVIPPGTPAGQTMRRLAVGKRLTEMQSELGETKPADLPVTDPRRAVLARLGAEWKALQAKVASKAA